MKYFIIALLGTLSIPLAVADGGPSLESIPANHVYVPRGFDSNDSSEVVVTGYLPNLCYKIANVSVIVKDKTIDLGLKAWKSGQGSNCPSMIVPVLEVAQVGVLESGEYSVVVNRGKASELKNTIEVKQANSQNIDDVVYANVSSASRVGRTRQVQLKGINPSTCYELDQIKYYSNDLDTWSILPVMKKVTDDCPNNPTPFTYTAEIPRDLEEANLLLHVRVMNGRSVNLLFDNR